MRLTLMLATATLARGFVRGPARLAAATLARGFVRGPARLAARLHAGASDVLGGEWAGWQCEFDALTGEVRRVPDHYCSETMLEWDAVPNGFELLTSETFGDDTLARDFLRLLPEEGCAVDDLSGEKSTSALSTASLRGANGVFTLDGGDRDDEWHLRTFFRAPSDDGAARRVRVSLRTDAAGSGPAPRKPRVRVALERRWSEAPALPEPTTTVGNARTGIAASWLSDKMAKARCFGDAAAPGADAEGVVWLPGAVGVRFADNIVRVVCRAGDTVLGCDRVFGFDGAPGPGDPLVFEEFGEAWEPPTAAY